MPFSKIVPDVAAYIRIYFCIFQKTPLYVQRLEENNKIQIKAQFLLATGVFQFSCFIYFLLFYSNYRLYINNLITPSYNSLKSNLFNIFTSLVLHYATFSM